MSQKPINPPQPPPARELADQYGGNETHGQKAETWGPDSYQPDVGGEIANPSADELASKAGRVKRGVLP